MDDYKYTYNEKLKKNLDDNYDIRMLKIKYGLQEHAKIVHMREIVVSSKDKSTIGTTALDTCYGIVFYDRKK